MLSWNANRRLGRDRASFRTTGIWPIRSNYNSHRDADSKIRRLVDIAHALNCRVVDLIGDLDDVSIPSPLFHQDTAHLREAGAPDLLGAYSALPIGTRKAVLKLMVEIVKATRVPAAA